MKKVDTKIEEAIETAVRDESQSEALSRLLVAWFEALASGNEDIAEDQSAWRRLELLYGETSVSGGGGENSLDHGSENGDGQVR